MKQLINRERRLPGRAWGILLLALAAAGISTAARPGQIGAESFSFQPRSLSLNPGGAEGIIIVDSGSVAFAFDKDSPMGIIIVDSGRTIPLFLTIVRGDRPVPASEVSIRAIAPDRDASRTPKPGSFKIGLRAAPGAESAADYQLRFDVGRSQLPIPREAFALQVRKGR